MHTVFYHCSQKWFLNFKLLHFGYIRSIPASSFNNCLRAYDLYTFLCICSFRLNFESALTKIACKNFCWNDFFNLKYLCIQFSRKIFLENVYWVPSELQSVLNFFHGQVNGSLRRIFSKLWAVETRWVCKTDIFFKLI